MPCKWRQWHGELNARLFACICECIYRKNFALSFVTVSCFLHRAPSVCSRDECARINSITVVAWKFIAPNRSYVLTTWCFFFWFVFDIWNVRLVSSLKWLWAYDDPIQTPFFMAFQIHTVNICENCTNLLHTIRSPSNLSWLANCTAGSDQLPFKYLKSTRTHR